MSRVTFLTPSADNSLPKSVAFCGAAMGAIFISAIVFLYAVSSFFVFSVGYRLDFTSQNFVMIIYAFVLMLTALVLSIVSKVINRKSRWAKTNIILSSIFLGCEIVWFLLEMLTISELATF